MEIAVSMLCAMDPSDVESMFAEKGQGSFFKLDAILKAQETNQLYVTSFGLTEANYMFKIPKQSTVSTAPNVIDINNI